MKLKQSFCEKTFGEISPAGALDQTSVHAFDAPRATPRAADGGSWGVGPKPRRPVRPVQTAIATDAPDLFRAGTSAQNDRASPGGHRVWCGEGRRRPPASDVETPITPGRDGRPRPQDRRGGLGSSPGSRKGWGLGVEGYPPLADPPKACPCAPEFVSDPVFNPRWATGHPCPSPGRPQGGPFPGVPRPPDSPEGR
jgi:hypothetical protein